MVGMIKDLIKDFVWEWDGLNNVEKCVSVIGGVVLGLIVVFVFLK